MLLRKRLVVPFALAGALLVPALPAAADDGGWRGHRGHHGHHKHHSKHHGGHHRHYRSHGHGDWHAPRLVIKNHYHGYPVHYYDSPAYYCGPCSHHFDSYDALSYHVHHHHHIAAIALPTVIFQASIGGGVGWVFDH